MTSLNLEWLFLKIYKLFTEGIHVGSGGHSGFKNTVVFLLSLISLVFLCVIIYSVIKLKDRNKLNIHKMHDAIHAAGKTGEEKRDNKRWQIVLDFITSNSPNDWRLAVIEADNMLDDLTKEIGLPGENLGERLKNAPTGDFKTLNNAWEAHKIRNRIAHEGMAYELEYREAKHAIEMFESVLREFGHV